MKLPEFDPHSVPVIPPPPRHEPVDGADFETLCEHFGEDRFAHGGSAAFPLYQASTFVFPTMADFERRKEPGSPYFEYTRVGNPTTATLEAKLARLERGQWAYVAASGMGAIAAAINACVQSGSHVVAGVGAYWPTVRLLKHWAPRFGVETTFIQSSDPQDYIDALRPETTLVYLESPSSGYFDVLDVAPITAVTRERGILTAFDNSWASPYFQNPLELGCDLVVHSATKYIGGHSDVVAGAVMGRDDDVRRRVFREIEIIGAVPDPFAAWLLMRGLRTLALRMEQHQRSALAIAQMLAEHPRVARVNHPGLPSHPQHEVARRQMRGTSSLFSFVLKDATKEAAHRFVDRLNLFHIGVSWGGHESLALAGTFFDKPGGTPEWVIRLHVGLESTKNLLADVRQALED